MNQQYLIPANSKRSMLILGLFTFVDLIIFGVGVVITTILLFTMGTNTVKDIIVVLTPLIISSIMVAPVPNHRNVWKFTSNVYNYFTNRKEYHWRGWCVIDERKEER